MDVDLSLDEIIERKRTHNNPPRANEKRLNAVLMKPRKPLNKPAGHQRTSFDARNKIIQKTRAKIVDARDILNQNMRDSGIDARSVLLERKKERMPMPPQSARMQSRVAGPGRNGGGGACPGMGEGGVHKGRFGQRMAIAVGNRPGAMVQTLWDPKDDLPHTHCVYKSSPFVNHGYVDYDNMQQLEDEEIARTLHMGSYNSSQQSLGLPRPRLGRAFDGYDLEMMDGVEITSVAGGSSSTAGDPFAMYEAARNRVERPTLPPPPHDGEKRFERRQRNLVATKSNLLDSLRARLCGNEPDRRVSHGIYANENGGSSGHQSSSGMSSMSLHQRRSPPSMPLPSLPLSVVNNPPGYRLLVSNLHSNVTTADIRELFNDIGPTMYDAHVVRPGTAEVIYKSLEHAEMAVHAYHLREFDGQPMHCVLVNPHSSNRSAHSVSSRTVTANSSGVDVDIDALHSVLFRDR